MIYRQRFMESIKRDPIICPCCGAEMELFRLWHPKYGTFYEGFDDYYDKSHTSPIADNKVFGYNEVFGYNKSFEQLILLS